MHKKTDGLSNSELIEGLKKVNKTDGKLKAVKWVWDNSSLGLKSSKDFVDEHI